MGCGTSSSSPTTTEYSTLNESSKHNKPHQTTQFHSAVLIQNWFRRYQARLEARRRCTWKIFQSIEYSGEQDQLKLLNFFTDMMSHIPTDNPDKQTNVITETLHRNRTSSTSSKESDDLDRLTDPSNIPVSQNYNGVTVSLPITKQLADKIINNYKINKPLHVKYVLVILREARERFKALPNVNRVTTSIARQMTICGDLHGKLSDLFIIFSKNGVPSTENPYIFNGDLVDRGPRSLEILIILFTYFIIYPNGVYINRGNHEDHIMNMRYGFIKEISEKYKEHSNKIIKLLEDIFGWLPLATVVDQKILVTHGGVSSITDLRVIEHIDRHKYVSVLKPSTFSGKERPDNAALREWRQVLDLLWSDPKPNYGCKPNTFRGGGCYFGPDVTDQVLKRHDFDLLVRSHECKYEGYEYMHDNKVVTIFSASNYYEQGSNRGAYMKIKQNEKPYFVQYQASSKDNNLTLRRRVSIVEQSAIKELKEKLYANKNALMEAFQEVDKENTGCLLPSQWASIVEKTLNLDVPWNMVKHQLVRVLPDGRVDYASCLEQYAIESKTKRVMYQCRSSRRLADS
ncbi:serine/threonine-protein phosphatase with EF-hands 2 isoform X2 [Exaiptasia diaphana]|uniref:Serine/threonine-protein phosphatase n=1 Tax=Exaiptasia diaphana TaxID=2652724 RepID=A0A913YSS0_EXADI|nr:serine/threonine-protein phosphatase with EF-hands 2 isoform X2 [Exaiptasia diaphana]